VNGRLICSQKTDPLRFSPYIHNKVISENSLIKQSTAVTLGAQGFNDARIWDQISNKAIFQFISQMEFDSSSKADNIIQIFVL